MSFKKKEDNILISSCELKEVSIIYIYKNNINDELDEELLFSEAIKKINDNEYFDIIHFIGNIWFGISNKCSTCIYIDFDENDIDINNCIKLLDSKKWKLNAGFINIINNYNKIIITSSKSPELFYKENKKWKELIKNFKIIKLD